MAEIEKNQDIFSLEIYYRTTLQNEDNIQKYQNICKWMDGYNYIKIDEEDPIKFDCEPSKNQAKFYFTYEN